MTHIHWKNWVSDDRAPWLTLGFAAFLCVLVLVGAFVPRAMAFLPGVVGLVGLVSAKLVLKEWPVFNLRILGILGGILALAALSAIWSIDSAESLERAGKLVTILGPGCLLLLCAAFYGERLSAKSLLLLPLCVMLALVVCMIDLVSAGGIHDMLRGIDRTKEFNESLVNRNVVLVLLSVFLALASIQCSINEKPKQLLGIGVILALVFTILSLTDSQSAQLAFIVGLACYLGFPVAQKYAWYALIALICGLVVTAPWLVQLLFSMTAANIDDIAWFMSGYAPHRMEIWDYVSRYALTSPLLGQGIEATKMVEAFDTQELYQRGKDILHPHNFAVQIWMEFGAIGALACCAFCAQSLLTLKDMPPLIARAGLASFAASLSVAATGYGLWQSWWVGTFLLLAALFLFLSSAYNAHTKR